MQAHATRHCPHRARGRSVREAHKSSDKLTCLSISAEKARSTVLEQQQQDLGEQVPADGPEGQINSTLSGRSRQHQHIKAMPIPVLMTALDQQPLDGMSGRACSGHMSIQLIFFVSDK